MELYAKDKDPKKDCRRYGHLEGKKCSSSGKNGRQVVGGEAKQVDAPSLYKIIRSSAKGTTASSTTSSRRTYLDYRWILTIPENLVWLTLGPLFFLAARLRNTTLLAIGGLPPGMVSQVGDFLTKGLEKVNLFASASVFQEAKYGHLFDNSLLNE